MDNYIESLLEDGLLLLISCHLVVWIVLISLCILGFKLGHG